MNAITIENIVAFDYEYVDKIYEAQNEVDAALAMKRATGYLKMWKDYHLREHMRIDNQEISRLFLQYESMIHKAFLKRCNELEQNVRFSRSPSRMNKSQLRALLKLYRRHNPLLTFLQLRRKAICYYGDYFGIELSGMFIGIERDGYAHT